MAQAIREGAFVVTNFPFGPPDRPDKPGPIPHIAYCLGVQRTGRGPELILAYTSSGLWRPGGGSACRLVSSSSIGLPLKS